MCKNMSQGRTAGLVSIIIPVYNRLEFTRACLDTLAANTPFELYEVIIVDNASTDGTGDFLRTLEGDVKVISNPTNLGFARACNQGARAAAGEFLLFLNNDTLPQPGWLEALLAAARDPTVAIVGAKLLFPDDTIQHAGVALRQDAPYPISPIHLYYQLPAGTPAANQKREVAAVTGACLLVRAGVFRALDGFDEGFVNGYEDVDLCLRVREKGYRIVYTPESVLYHFESVSEGRHARERENLSLLHKKWLGRIPADLFLDPEGGEQARAGAPADEGSGRGAASVVVVAYNSLATIAPCLRSVRETLAPQDEAIVVDNASRDGTREYLERVVRGWDRFRIFLNDRNLGFSRACNQGIAAAAGDYVVLLNPDTVVSPGWLSRLAAHLQDPTVGAVGPVSDRAAGLQKHELYLGQIQLPRSATVRETSEALYRQNRGGAADTKLLIGFCQMIPRRVLDEVGPLDEDLFLGHEDLELSWRLRRHGYRLLVAMDTFVRHRGQASFRTEPAWKTRYLVRQSANFLANKLARAYGRDMVPTPREIWGIDWFTPTGGTASVVIPALEPSPSLRACVESVLANTPEARELIIVHAGAAADPGADLEDLRGRHPEVEVVSAPAEEGFAAACNRGLAAATGDHVVLLDSRVIVTPGWLTRMLAATATDERIGLIGPRWNGRAGPQAVAEGPADDDRAALERFAADYILRHAGEGHEAEAAAGFCLLIERPVLAAVGGLDVEGGLDGYEDLDLCLRARAAGFRVWICDDVWVHLAGTPVPGGVFGGRRPGPEAEERFARRWGVTPARLLAGAPLPAVTAAADYDRQAAGGRPRPTAGGAAPEAQLVDAAAEGGGMA